MAIHFTCPHCQKSIRVPDDAGGRTGRCPGCMTSLTVPRSDAEMVPEAEGSAWAPPSDYLEEEAAPRAARGAGWTLARFGLNSLHIGSTLFIAGVGFATAWAIAVGLRKEPLRADPLLTAIGMAIIISVLLVFAGIVLICFTPSISRARGFAVASLLCTVGFVASSIYMGDEMQARRAQGNLEQPPGLSILVSILFLATWVFLGLYTRNIGRHFGNHALRISSGRWIRFLLFGILGWVLFWFVAGIVLRNPNQLVRLLGLANFAFLIFAIIFAVWYLRNVRSAAVTIRDARLEPEVGSSSPERDDLAWESLSDEPSP